MRARIWPVSDTDSPSARGLTTMVRTGRMSGEGGGDAPPVTSRAKLSQARAEADFIGILIPPGRARCGPMALRGTRVEYIPP